jgi:hypothetical protein
MKTHRRYPGPGAIHGFFSRELASALTIAARKVVAFQTPGAGWGAIEQDPEFTLPRDFAPRDLDRDVAIRRPDWSRSTAITVPRCDRATFRDEIVYNNAFVSPG